MYQYVDAEIVKLAYPKCADLLNQLKMALKEQGIETDVNLVGSANRKMVTQRGNEPFDFDFNLEILDVPNIRDCRWIKNTVMGCFDDILSWNGYLNCSDSTSVISTGVICPSKDKRIKCKIDICIIYTDREGYWYRLIHDKTGVVQLDQYHWDKGFKSKLVREHEAILKADQSKWSEVRRAYLKKKDMYASRHDKNHPSFVCYVEAVNDIYQKYYQQDQSINRVLGFENMMNKVSSWK